MALNENTAFLLLDPPPMDMFQCITVVVGQVHAAQYFSLPYALLKRSSQFFAGALSGSWQESGNKTVSFSEEDPALFAYYAGWIIGACNLPLKKIECKDKSERTGKLAAQRGILVRLYQLGEKLCDFDFMDFTLTALYESINSNHQFSLLLAHEIYRNSLPRSELKHFFVASYAELSRKGWLIAHKPSELPVEFLFDLSVLFINMIDGQRRALKTSTYLYDAPRFITNICDFHMHTKEGKPCPVDKLPANEKKRKFCFDEEPQT